MSDEETPRDDSLASSVTESFGDYLKRHREASGKSLEEIAATTRISKRYLEAFETNNLDRFPEAAFTRGFLKNYAQEVGIDLEECMGRYEQFLRASMPTQIRDLKKSGSSPSRLLDTKPSVQPWAWVVGGIAILLVGIAVLIWSLGLKIFDSSVDLAEREDIESNGYVMEELSYQSTESRTELPDVRPSLLQIESTQRRTLLIRLDETASQEIMLAAGEKKTFEVFRQVEIQNLDQAGLTLSYNGQALEVSGSSVKLFNRHLFND